MIQVQVQYPCGWCHGSHLNASVITVLDHMPLFFFPPAGPTRRLTATQDKVNIDYAPQTKRSYSASVEIHPHQRTIEMGTRMAADDDLADRSAYSLVDAK